MTSEKKMITAKNEAPRSEMRGIKAKFAEAYPPSLAH
jgi:hypothetical protein